MSNINQSALPEASLTLPGMLADVVSRFASRAAALTACRPMNKQAPLVLLAARPAHAFTSCAHEHKGLTEKPNELGHYAPLGLGCSRQQQELQHVP